MAAYIDLNTTFRKSNIDNTSTVSDIKSIAKGLERLFTTGKGEVPFNRNYGTTLKSLLFENNVDPSDIRIFLYQDITNFEPRINVNPSDIEIVQTDLNTYMVSCTFTVPSLNNASGTAISVLNN